MKSFFTLIEVVIAVAILAMGTVAIMGITVSSANRMGKAITKWNKQHMLSQATEYYLLAGPKESVPEEFFPFDGFRSECTIEESTLPEGVEPEIGNWRFATLKISVYNDSGDEVISLKMDKIFRKEDVE